MIMRKKRYILFARVVVDALLNNAGNESPGINCEYRIDSINAGRLLSSFDKSS